MNEKFFELKKEKQDRMINAALKVFSQYGYRHASTDEIVREAGISKGLLFHYFDNKIGLYGFLYDYATRFVTLELSAGIEKDETEYFALYRQVLTAKTNTMTQYPRIFLFLKRADEETDGEAAQEISEKRQKYHDMVNSLRERADITGFVPGTDYIKVGNILDYTMDGLLLKHIKGASFRADLFLDEALEYVDMIEKLTTPTNQGGLK